MTGLLSGRPFVAVFPELVRSLGSMEAAAVLQHVAFRQPETGEPVAIPVADFCAATGLSESTIKRHTKALAERGVLVRERPSRAGAATYAVVRDHELVEGSGRPVGGVKVTPHPSYRESQEQPSPPQASGGAPPVLALVASGVEPEPALFASSEVEKPETWPPEATANGCRQAWVVAWTEHHGPPDPSIKKRALGGIARLAKDRTDLCSWRALWQAAHDAGKAGRWNVSDFLCPAPVSRYPQRENHYLALARQAADDGLLDDMLTGLEHRTQLTTRPATGGLRP